jgi:hypothetical protein
MSYIHMELLVKTGIVTLYVQYMDPRLAMLKAIMFLFAAQCFNIESMKKVFLCHSYV